MTRDENQVLIEVANDVKWLKQAIEENARTNTSEHGKIIVHLGILNGRTSKNTTSSLINRYGLAINFSILAVVITVLLHLMGIY